MPTTILTDIAEIKITKAAGSGSQVAITHVALGDGQGGTYAPDFGQTALRRERVRQPIDRRYQTSPNAWLVKAEFGPDTTVFQVREAGFFDADGDLIALCTFPADEVRQTGGITYLIAETLQFNRVADGLVIVDAPDDQLIDFQVATLTSLAAIRHEQFKQSEILRAAAGPF